MKVLCVASHLPRDFDTEVQGCFKRLRMLVSAAVVAADSVDLLVYLPPTRDISEPERGRLEAEIARKWQLRVGLMLAHDNTAERPFTRWRRYVSGVFDTFGSARAVTVGEAQQAAFEAALARRPDRVLLIRMASTFPAMRAQGRLPPVLFDLDDIEHVAWARELRQSSWWHPRQLLLLQTPSLWLTERRAIALARQAFVCSAHDQRYLRRWMGVTNVTVVPNAVRMPPPEALTRQARPTLLLLGVYSYPPNADAARLLLTQIWPRVRAAVPEARLIVAGASPERVAHFAAGDARVEIPGVVPDLDALYASVRVVVAPIQFGGGTRFKIVEAAAYGKAIVSTRLGAEGLDLRDGSEIALRDDPEGFARACVDLLRDDDACFRMGSAARARALERYDHDRIVASVAAQIALGREAADAIH